MSSLAVHTIGLEQRPVAVIDDFATDLDALIAHAERGEPFLATPGDLYPGIRKSAPPDYAEFFCSQYTKAIREHFALPAGSNARVVFSMFSITTTEPHRLRPIQQVPHFDTSAANQLAVVHYLCGPEHGGTSFYRHRSTGFESIGDQRVQRFAETLKSEVMAERPPRSKYMDGDDALFVRTASFAARCNRALIYPSNVLHSGNIRRISPPGTAPRDARLTLNTFVRFE